MHKLLFVLSAFFLAIGQFSSIVKSGGFNLYLFDVFVGLYSLYGLLGLLISKKLVLPRFIMPFVVFTAVAAISMVLPAFKLHPHDFMSSLFYLLRWAIYLLSSLVTFNHLKHKVFDVGFVIKTIVYFGLFVAFLGFVQLALLPDFEALDPVFGWDPHKNRLASTFFDPNFVGGYLGLILAITLFAHYKKIMGSRQTGFLFAVLTLALLLTFSRSSWGLWAIVMFSYGVVKSRKLILLAVLLLFLAYFAVPRVQTRVSGITDPADSAHYRINSWSSALMIAEYNLLLGTGYNTYRYAQQDLGYLEPGTLGGNSGAGTDSSFLLVLATTGIFGMISFVYGYFSPFWGALSHLTQKSSKGKTVSVFLVACLAGLFLQSQFINSLFYPQIMFVWLTVISIFSYYSLRS